MRRDITNQRCLTKSRRIRSALEVAEHLRNLFSTPEYLKKHADMKINEIVVMYIDKDESDPNYPQFHWPAVEPKYSTFTDISKKYCFRMGGGGRAAGRRCCCFCEACCLALEDGTGMTQLLDIPGCKRRHLSTFAKSEQTIKCTAAAGLANQKVRAKALWKELQRVLKAGKHVAIQARTLWGEEERRHLRPGHFWAAELGDADGKGSPILHTFTRKNEYFELSDGSKVRGDAGEHVLLLCRYFHRTVEDSEGLTFKQWQAKKGEVLAVNSSEVRAVQGHQKNDFQLQLINPPKQRQNSSRDKKKASAPQTEIVYSPHQKWGLDPDIDRDTRKVCEST